MGKSLQISTTFSNNGEIRKWELYNDIYEIRKYFKFKKHIENFNNFVTFSKTNFIIYRTKKSRKQALKKNTNGMSPGSAGRVCMRDRDAKPYLKFGKALQEWETTTSKTTRHKKRLFLLINVKLYCSSFV